jgi:hypothetical protein
MEKHDKYIAGFMAGFIIFMFLYAFVSGYSIRKGLTQVSKVVQTNSATAAESAASSEELSGQSNFPSEPVEKFKLKN